MSLGDQLRAAIQWQASSSDKGFIPLDQIDAIINRVSIKNEILRTPNLHVIFAEYGDALIDNILGLDSQTDHASRKVRLFAILSLVGCVEKIVNFLDGTSSDEILPVSIENNSSDNEPYVLARDRTTSLATCFNSWERSTLEAFEKQQWVVLAPVFRRDVPFLNLSPKAILPFVQDELYPQRRGGTSNIIRVKIHPSHLDVDKKEPVLTFAVKRLRSAEKDSFCRELKALRRFSSPGVPQHPNILEFVSAWHQDGYYNIIFPWAVSDLGEWWKENPLPTNGPGIKTTQWLANQTAGIALGLSAVHQFLGSSGPNSLGYTGRHGDIKPGNILWFPDPEDPGGLGTWKISDFGLSGVGSRPRLMGTRRLGCTPAYRAPEYDAPEQDISMSYDVWSLGCVLLECLTWSLVGLEGIKELEARRFETGTNPYSNKGDAAFWETTKPSDASISVNLKFQPTVKVMVKKWMDRLRESGRGQSTTVNTYVDELSTLIEKSMLVINDQKRSSSSEVANKLQEMRDKLLQQTEIPDDELRCASESFAQFNGHSIFETSSCNENGPVSMSAQAAAMSDISASILEDGVHSTSSADLLALIDNESHHSMLDFMDSGNSADQDWSSLDGFAPTLPESARSDNDATELGSRKNSPVEHLDSVTSRGSKRRLEAATDKESPGTCMKHRRLEPSLPSRHTTGPPVTSNKPKSVQPAAPSSKTSSNSGTLRFACPFHKHDPKTFGIHEPRWRTCVGPGWTTIHRVKEHIDRKHSVQPNTCSRCLAAFPSPFELSQHQKSETPCKVHREPCYRVTEAQRALMRKRPRGRSDIGAWNDMYRIIFDLSESDPVPWPYYEATAAPEEDSPKSTSQPESSSLNEFEDYLTQNVIPNADEETMAKVQGYLDLARRFRESTSQTTSQMANETVLSSVPSLVSDGFSQMAHSQLSTESLMELPILDPATIFDPSMIGSGLEMPACGSLNSWNPDSLTKEEEDLSRMLFNDMSSQDADQDWQQIFAHGI